MTTAIRSARPVSASPFNDFCRRYWPGRAASNAIGTLHAGRAFVLLQSGRVWSVSSDWEESIFIHCGGGGAFEEFDCGHASNRVQSFIAACLARSAALEAARRLNGLAASLRGASVERRCASYADAFNAAFCLWSSLGSAWGGDGCADEDHPSRRSAALSRLWDRMFMNMLVSPGAARLVHEAAAAEYGLPVPSGDFDPGYGRCNLPYLFDAWSDAGEVELSEGEDASLRMWAYRIYAPFADPAPEGIEFPWHCAAAASHPQDAGPRFEDEDDPAAPVRGRARRLA